MEDLVIEICNINRIKTDELFEKNRRIEIVTARHLLFWCLHERGYCDTEIARKLQVNRLSVYYGHKKINDLIKINDKRTIEAVKEIKEFVKFAKL